MDLQFSLDLTPLLLGALLLAQPWLARRAAMRQHPAMPGEIDLDALSIFAHDEGVMVIDRGPPQRRIMVALPAIAAALGVPADRLTPRTAENWVRIHVQSVFDAAEAQGLASGYARIDAGQL